MTAASGAPQHHGAEQKEVIDSSATGVDCVPDSASAADGDCRWPYSGSNSHHELNRGGQRQK